MQRDYADYLLIKTREDYNLIAEDFSRTRENIWEELDTFKEYVKDGDRVLDVGCGNGRLLELLKGRDVLYTGLDASEKLIEIAKQKYPGLRFLVADALHLPVVGETIDKIFLIAVLHQIPSAVFREQVLKEAKRVLKPNGLIVITVWKFHRLEEFYLLFKYTILKIMGKSKLGWKDIFDPWGEKTQRYYHWFSRRELKGLAKKSGFKIQKSGILKNKKGNRQNIYLIAEKENGTMD